MYRALLISNSIWPEDPNGLPPLKGPQVDSLVLWRALTRADSGLFEDHSVTVLQERSQREILEAAEGFFGSAATSDTLLIYFSGHGLIAGDRLYLCARDTSSTRLRASAVSADELSKMITDSKAAAAIIILDCCYSGGFKGSQPLDRQLSSLGGTGRYAIAATSPDSLALDSTEIIVPSPFTGALVDSLEFGAQATSENRVDLDDLMRDIEGRIPEGLPTPKRNFDGSGRVVIAKRTSMPAPSVPDKAATRARRLPEPDQQATVTRPLEKRAHGDLVMADLMTWRARVCLALVALVASLGTIQAATSTYSPYENSEDSQFNLSIAVLVTCGVCVLIVVFSILEGVRVSSRGLRRLGRRSVLTALPRLIPKWAQLVQVCMCGAIIGLTVFTAFGVPYYLWEWAVCLGALGLYVGLILARISRWGDEMIIVAGAAIALVGVTPMDVGAGLRSGTDSALGIIWIGLGIGLVAAWFWWSPRPVVVLIVVALMVTLLSSFPRASFDPRWVVTAESTILAFYAYVSGAGRPLVLGIRESRAGEGVRA